MTLGLVLAALGVVTIAPPSLRRVRRRRPIGDDDLVLVGDLVSLGLLAGMPFFAALHAAGAHVDAPVGSEIRRITREARLDGAATVFARASGPLAPLLVLAGRATRTGAPMVTAVAGFTAEARNATRTRAVEDARRLSVRLLFPLALLILPGFVLLVAGPIVLDGLHRLGW